MNHFAGKRIWLVGASEGLGAALAKGLSARGAHVIVSARNADRLATLSDGLPGTSDAVPMDVQDRASVEQAAKQVGDIDIMVYLAGAYWPMRTQDWNADQAEAMADVNFTGAVRVLGQVVPDMVARDAGQIVITGSLSGFRGLPGTIGYSASKAGVMALAESMQADLHKTGVSVQLANPGFIKTRLTDKNDFAMPFLMTPEQAAQDMMTLMARPDRFERHFPRVFSWLFRLSRFFPLWLYNRVFA